METEKLVARVYGFHISTLKERLGIEGERLTRVEMGKNNENLIIATEERKTNRTLNEYTTRQEYS